MKDSYYFPHDYNAANDQKILKVRAKFNNTEGYAIVFMVFEVMAQEESGYLDRGAIGGLSLGYSIPISTLNAVIDFCIEISLFNENEMGIFNKRMLDHKKLRLKAKEYGKKGSEARWGNKDSIPNSPPIPTPNAKERKVKESIGGITLTKNQIEKLQKDFPSLDVLSSYRKFKIWQQSTGATFKNSLARFKLWLLEDLERQKKSPQPIVEYADFEDEKVWGTPEQVKEQARKVGII